MKTTMLVIFAIILILLSNFPCSFSIRIPSSTEKKEANGLTIPIYQQNRLQVLDPLSVAPFQKYPDRIIYNIEFVVGTPPEKVIAAFDTGSTFTWVREVRVQPSTTYRPVGCSEFLCGDVPNSACSDDGETCLYGLRYLDGSTSIGKVGKDIFSLYSPNKTGHESNPTVSFEMMYGTPNPLTHSLDGIIGAEGLRKALQVNSFSVCYPRPSTFQTYVRFGEHAFILGKTTPLFRSRGHYMFTVTSISNGGLFLDTNLTAGEDTGIEFIFDTGAGYSYLHPVAFKSLIDSVKESVSAAPVTKSIPSGHELCYAAADLPSYRTVDIIFHIDGPSGNGFLKFNYYNLWKSYQSHACECICFTFRRSRSFKSILGVQHMLGYNFAIETDSMMLSYEESNCKLVS